MMAGSCEESISAQEITELTMVLNRAFTSYEKDAELSRNPAVWVEYIQDCLRRVDDILALRSKSSDLEPKLFNDLETSSNGAETRMHRYGRMNKLPDFI